MNAGSIRATRVVTRWRLGLWAPLVTHNKLLCRKSNLNKELLALSSAGVSLCHREAGERKKESDTQQEPVRWREREREDALKTTAAINSDEDHESDHTIILHPTVMTMIFKLKKGVM